MAVLDLEARWKKSLSLIGTAFAAVAGLPALMMAQAQKMNGDWLQLTPSDPKAGIVMLDSKASVSIDGDGTTTMSVDRRGKYRSPRDSAAAALAYKASKRDQKLRLVVSLEDRTLWVVAGIDTVLEAPVAIGKGETLIFGERKWTFDTPRGIRSVRGKDSDPKWIPPDWHYAETATEYGLKLAHLSLTNPHRISGGRRIAFRNGEAGVIDPDSGFAFLPLDEEIVFDNTLFIPPVGSKNRQIQGELGKYKLDTGGGVLFHGTPYQNSIGRAATHGCIRLRDEDIAWLYEFVPVGTRVYIY